MRDLTIQIPSVALTLLTLGVFTDTASAQQLITTGRADYASAAGARGVTAADFNRDGWIDVAVANHTPDGVSVLLNQQGTGFTASFIPLPGGPFDITAGDLNNDGLPDIAVANADANMINVAFGRAAGGFTTPLQIGAMGNPRGLTLANMDRDGYLDIVYTQYYFQGVQVLHGDGRGNFVARMGAATVGPNPQGVVAADFNLDGRMDLAVASTTGVGLTVLYQQPPGNYLRQDSPGRQSLNVLTVGDFNRDGWPDVAAASSSNGEVSFFHGTKKFGLVLSITARVDDSPRGIAAVDLNRDGALDVVTGNRASSTVTAIYGDGNGEYRRISRFAVGAGGRTVAIADYNNDGRPDVATGNEYAQNVTVLTNTTDYLPSAFAFHATKIGPTTRTYIGAGTTDVADFDLDGKPDIVTQGSGNYMGYSLAVLSGNGTATSLPARDIPLDLKAGHFNNDAYPDVLFLDRPLNSSSANTTLFAFIGDGTGRFPNAATTETNIIAEQLEVGDLNSDGRTDAVIAGWAGIIQVFLGNGDGRFTFAGNVYADLQRSRVTLADVDRDGYLDIGIYSMNESPNSFVEYRINNRQPMPSFSRRGVITFDRWVLVEGARFGDLNHDGYLDLVACGGWNGPNLAVALGGPQGFGTPAYFPSLVYPFELVDITLDGHLDVVNDAGEVMPGRGNGTFGTPQRFDFFPTRVQIVDFNRDGLPDILRPMDMGAAEVLLNQRTGTNTPPAVDAGPDLTLRYNEQFQEDDFGIYAWGTDADMHWVSYEWTDESGRLLSRDRFYGIPEPLPTGRHEFFVTVSDGRGGTARDSTVITIEPEKEIVIYAARAGSLRTWESQPDSTAANGSALHDANMGAPKVTAPLADPSSYAEFWFAPDPTQTYKLWVRLKADSNYWANDSVWLQFSGAVDQNGNAYEPGTTSGIAVNLEECSGCGVSGWGWRDDAWGSKGVMSVLTLRFPQNSFQRIRIQTREDGVSIDQIVLSSEKYVTTRPGAVKNDATILHPTYW